MSLITSPRCMAFSIPNPKSTVNFSPGSPEAALIPSLSLNSSTRKPSKPAFFNAKRYSASYMPKRQGPQEPAGKKTKLSRICWPGLPPFLQKLEILHEVTHGEVGGIALAVVSKLLAGLEGGDVRHRQFLAAITAAL